MAEEGRRDFVKHSFFKVSSQWRRLPPGERDHSKNQFAEVVAEFADRITLGSYSLVGTRADVDFMLWEISPTLEAINELQAQLNRTAMQQRRAGSRHLSFGRYQSAAWNGSFYRAWLNCQIVYLPG